MMVMELVTSADSHSRLRRWRSGFGALYPQFETENAAQIPRRRGADLHDGTIALLGAVISVLWQAVYQLRSEPSSWGGRWWSTRG